LARLDASPDELISDLHLNPGLVKIEDSDLPNALVRESRVHGHMG
jgi:hypothetical protein